MRILLDSHVLLWVLWEHTDLDANILDMVNDPNNIPMISIASLWELTIKESNSKITLPSDFIGRLEPAGYEFLPINKNHLARLKTLPFIHKDPFDRMLIAQAQAEEYPLVTADKEIHKYDVTTLVA